MDKEAVYIVTAYVDERRFMSDYPQYELSHWMIGSALSLEGARAIIGEDLGKEQAYGELHHYHIGMWPLGLRHGINASLAEYTFDPDGRPLETRDYPFMGGEFRGRKREEFRFGPGDLCEALCEGNMHLGIVVGLPVSEMKAKEMQRRGEKPDKLDDCYQVLFFDNGTIVFMDYYSTEVFPASRKVPFGLRRRLKNAYRNFLTAPLRLQIADTVAVSRLRQVLDELGLDAQIHVPADGSFPLQLLFPGGQPFGWSDRSVYIDRETAHSRMERVRATLFRECGKKAGGRGYPMSLCMDDDGEYYYIGPQKHPILL